MLPNNLNRNTSERILARVPRENFVGRSADLNELVHVASGGHKTRGLLLLLAPTAGVSELFRQTYDYLFRLEEGVIPVYFAVARNAKAPETASRFFETFLQQFVAFRRRDPTLVNASMTMRDLIELSDPADEDWLTRLLDRFEGERRKDMNGESFIRLCLSLPQRASMRGLQPFVMFDALQLFDSKGEDLSFGAEIGEALFRSVTPFALAGLRRGILDLIDGLYHDPGGISTRRLEQLGDTDARELVEQIARSSGIAINDQTRDLVVQQFSASPFFITSFVQSAFDRGVNLTGFVDCQQLYVDELMGGRIGRHFDAIFDRAAPADATKRNLTRVLYEAIKDDGRSPLETWRRRLGLEERQFQQVMRMLHAQELVSVNSNFVRVEQNPPVWRDYLEVRYRLEVAAEPRALVVADTLISMLKRAPHTMARRYRREAAVGVSDLIKRFNCQRVPASLLHYERFSSAYKGAPSDEISAGLDAEADLVRLPQVVHVSSCASFKTHAQLMCDEERCAVAHGFDAGNYTDGNEVIWIVAEIESKLEAGRGIVEVWISRLLGLAQANGFKRVHLWLIAPEGFTPGATELLAERGAYGSSRLQVDLLAGRVAPDSLVSSTESGVDEFELVIPMGDDSELIAAETVERIARRSNFQPEAINQIKTALIEACINATEHSLSPDRKIYQRYQVTDDRLVITVSSRGVVPTGMLGRNGKGPKEMPDQNDKTPGQDRRGWGLRLIKSLMDEVEFERVDDGTRLRMTKYLKK